MQNTKEKNRLKSKDYSDFKCKNQLQEKTSDKIKRDHQRIKWFEYKISVKDLIKRRQINTK